MAKTLYQFRADLKDLVKLNAGLKEAKINLDNLKRGTLEYNAQLKRMSGSMAAFKAQSATMKGMVGGMKSVNSQGNKMVSIFKSASIAIASAFAFRAIIGSITGVIKSFSEFESRMAAVKAISGATDDEFKELTKSALKLGSTTVFTASQVASLQEEFARLGFTTKEILAAQAATLDLAAATGEDLSSAAAIAGSSIRAFGLEAEQIVRVTNVMGAAFTNSALNLERFTQSMKFVAPVGKAAGFTIEETTALLMNLADAGLHGSIAGNGLKNIFIKLGDANSKLRKEIGHSVQGLPQMIEVLRGMKEESFGLTDAVELLDKRSAPAFLSLLENIDGLEANLDTLNGAEGVISEMAAIRLDTLEGDFTLLKSAMEGLGIAVGESFSLSMRQAVYEFTKFVQGLQEGSGFVNNLKLALKILRGVVIGVVAKFIILRAAMLPAMFTGAARGVGLMAVSMKALITGTRSAAVAMRGLRMAISSTGIGLLVVGLGMLVDWLVFSSKEVGELEMKMDRMTKSFNEDLKAITELNEGSQERHDLLRKLNTAYPELLGNIDLEILSNEELLKVLKLVNETSGIRMAIEANKDKISLIDKEAAEDEVEVLREILDVEEMIAKKRKLLLSDDISSYARVNAETGLKTLEYDLKFYKERIDIIRDNAEEEKDVLLESHDFYVSKLDSKLKEEEVYNKATLESDTTFRLSLRKGYKKDLEVFRTMKFGKQLLRIKEAEAQLEQLKNEADLFENKRMLWEEEMTWQLLIQISKDSMDNKQLRLKISEMESFVADMKALNNDLFKDSGGSGKKTLQGFKLENTKNQLKELFDLQNKMISDTEKQEMDASQKEFTFKQQKYQKEQDLMVKNMESIDQISKQGGKKGDAQIRADIKKNKSKYAVLKNMDMDEWNDLMNRKKTDHDDLLVVLDAMYAEEAVKLQTNQLIIEEQIDVHEKEKLIIIAKYQEIRRQQQIDIHESELKMEDDSIINFFKKRKKRADLLEEEHQDEIASLLAKFKSGELSEKQHEEALTVLRAKHRSEKQDNTSKGIQEEIAMYKDMYSQIFDAASSVWNNIQEMKMKTINETHERELLDLSAKQERELELNEGNAIAQENINKTYDERKLVAEKQKEEALTRIKKKQFQVDKANSIVMALINGYQAITKVSAETGLAAIIAAPIMSALIAAQVAAIASQKFTGAKGGIIPEGDKFAQGGIVQGASHSQGGVHFNVGGRQVELEGKEVVVNKRSSAIFHDLLSDINSYNGYGVKFAAGGITPGTSAVTNKKGGGFNVDELAYKIAGAVNSKQVYVVESDISGVQNTVAVSEANSIIF